MPLVPSISSDQTPPSQVPQYSNRLASVASPRCPIATPAVSQNKIVYPASRTTLYRRSSSSCAVEMRLSSGSREILQLAGGEDAWRLAVEGIDAVRGTLPGARQLPGARHSRPLRNRIDAFGVLHGRSDRSCGASRPHRRPPRRTTDDGARRPPPTPGAACREARNGRFRAPPKLGQAAGNSVPTRKHQEHTARIKSVQEAPSRPEDYRAVEQEPSRAVRTQASRAAVGRCEPGIGGNEHGQQRDEA